MNCNVCVRRCWLKRGGAAGFCGGYANVEGRLTNIAYGRLAVVQRQPLHHLPLYSWNGRSECLAFASFGCSARCTHCCNWEWAHHRPSAEDLEGLPQWSPENLVAVARLQGLALATDFVEPVNLFDFIVDAFTLARQQGVSTIFCTAGLLTAEALGKLLPVTDVVRLDIKGWTRQALKAQGFGGSRLTPKTPLITATAAREHGCHLELTVCIIPGVNDDPNELEGMALWVIRNLGNETPVTLIGHWKRGLQDPWPEAKDEEVEMARGVLSAAGLHVDVMYRGR